MKTTSITLLVEQQQLNQLLRKHKTCIEREKKSNDQLRFMFSGVAELRSVDRCRFCIH